MGFPLKANYKPRQALCQISFDDLNTICNVLNTFGIVMVPAGSLAEVKRNASGKDWQIVIPQGGGGAPDTTGKTKGMVYQIIADEIIDPVTGTITPPTAGFDLTADCAETVTVHRTDGSTIVLSLRQVTVCVNAVEKTAWVLMSEPA